MKGKTLAIVVAVLGILAALALINRGDRDLRGERAGAGVVDPGLIERASQVTLLEGDGEALELVRDGAHWLIAGSEPRLPADFDRLSRLMQNVLDLRYDRFVSERPETLERLELGSRALVLRDADAELLRIDLGKPDATGGFFAALSGEPGAWLLRGNLFFETDAEGWVDPTPFGFEPAAIVSLSAPAVSGGETLAVVRGEDSGWTSADGNRPVSEAAVNELAGRLAAFRFDDLVPRDDPEFLEALEESRSWTFGTAGGATIEVILCRRPERQVVIEQAPAADASAGGAEPEYETLPAGPPFAVLAATGLDGPWPPVFEAYAFRLAPFRYGPLARYAEDLLADQPAELARPTG